MLSFFLDTEYIQLLTQNCENFSIFLFLLEIVLLLDVFFRLPVRKDVCIFRKPVTSLYQILMLYNFTATDLYFLSIQQFVSLVFNMFCVLLYHRYCVIRTLLWVLTRTVLKKECNVVR